MRLLPIDECAEPQASNTDLASDMGRMSIQGPKSIAQAFPLFIGTQTKLTTLLDQLPLQTSESELVALLSDADSLQSVVTVVEQSVGEDTISLLGKICRTIDRVRYRTTAILQKARAGESFAKSILEGIHNWQNNAFKLMCELSDGQSARAEYHERHADVAAIAIDTSMTMSKLSLVPADPKSQARSLDLLQRSERLINRSRAPDSELQDWSRCLSNAAWSCGAGIYRLEMFVPAKPFIQIAVDLGVKALDSCQKRTTPIPTDVENEWKLLNDVMPQRWEALSVCYSRADQKWESLRAKVRCIQSHAQQVERIGGNASSLPPSAIFSAGDKFTSVLARVASTLISDALIYSNDCATLVHDLFDWDETNLTAGVIVEHITACMQALEYRPEVSQIMRTLLEKLIRTYEEADCPIRQVRQVFSRQLQAEGASC